MFNRPPAHGIPDSPQLWTGRRKRFFNKALARLIFIDETSTNTKLTKRTGWAPKGERFRTHAPFGKWQTQTSSLDCDATALSRRGSSTRR